MEESLIRECLKIYASLGIEADTGPAYTLTSNAVVERHHAIVDRILEKMVEDRPGIDIQEALGWAIHSHMYPGTHGWSLFQLTFGRNPRIPGVGSVYYLSHQSALLRISP